jgi:hypothetical protein
MKGEKEKEIFLNGEVQEIKKVSGFVTFPAVGAPI